MTLVAIFHSNHNHLPVVMEVKTYGKFIDCCGTVSTDWAHLMNKETGEILQTWKKSEPKPEPEYEYYHISYRKDCPF